MENDERGTGFAEYIKRIQKYAKFVIKYLW